MRPSQHLASIVYDFVATNPSKVLLCWKSRISDSFRLPRPKSEQINVQPVYMIHIRGERFDHCPVLPTRSMRLIQSIASSTWSLPSIGSLFQHSHSLSKPFPSVTILNSIQLDDPTNTWTRWSLLSRHHNRDLIPRHQNVHQSSWKPLWSRLERLNALHTACYEA